MTKAQLFHGHGNCPLPICLGCRSQQQGLKCDCADTFVQGEGGAPVELLKLAAIAEAEYLNKLKTHLDVLGHMRDSAATANSMYRK